MRVLSARGAWGAVLCAAALLFLAPWAVAEEKEANPQQAGAVERVEKQLESIQSRMLALQEQEFNINLKVMDAQQRANKCVENPGNAASEIAKGGKNPKLREYKSIMLTCAQQLQAFDGKLAPLLKSLAALERDRAAVPDNVKARIDEVASRVRSKHRTNLEKIANVYEQTAEWRPALTIYLGFYKEKPEAERLKDRTLSEKIADLYDKSGDPRNALAIYKGLFEGKKPNERYNDRGLGEKLGDAYEKCGDLKAAFTTYKGLLDALPKDKRDTDGKGLQEKMENVGKKGGAKK